MTKAEQAGLKTYPENIGYSTIGDVMYDYNAEKRRVYVAGYEKGYKDVIDKVCELIFEYNKRQARKFGAKSMMRLPDYTINVGDFRKIMEDEQ